MKKLFAEFGNYQGLAIVIFLKKQLRSFAQDPYIHIQSIDM